MNLTACFDRIFEIFLCCNFHTATVIQDNELQSLLHYLSATKFNFNYIYTTFNQQRFSYVKKWVTGNELFLSWRHTKITPCKSFLVLKTPLKFSKFYPLPTPPILILAGATTFQQKYRYMVKSLSKVHCFCILNNDLIVPWPGSFCSQYNTIHQTVCPNLVAFSNYLFYASWKRLGILAQNVRLRIREFRTIYPIEPKIQRLEKVTNYSLTCSENIAHISPRLSI